MGCCMSTSTRSTANKLSSNQNPQHPPNHHHHRRRQVPESDTSNVRAPPLPPHEEETVKEVLSETPIFKPTRTTTTTTTHHDVELEEEKKVEPKKAEMMVCTPPEVSEVSEVSEMYSTTTMSESFSANTMADKREEEVTSRQCGQLRQRGDRSPARKRPYSGELAGAKERRVRSPGQRSEPVQRTNIGSRTVRGRESGQLTAKRRNVGPAGIRRDPGDISGRRSRSPVTRKEGVPTRNVGARGQTLKMTGRTSDLSPAPVVSENSDNRHLTPVNESIENPLVSLECFIFL